ncbi:MAG: amidohydrolase family protein [Nitriliruptorales bacterium]|nr:amidohydrolase family protein [Nitriliruptorales bacterium]
MTAVPTERATAPADNAAGEPTPRGTLLTADRIVTLGHGRYRARALVIRGKRVVWVGDDPAQAPPHAGRIDLDGCVVGPAFVDSHAHLTSFGIGLTGLDLSEARSGDDVLHAVRSYAGQHPGRVVMGQQYDPNRFDGALPSPDELSEAAGGRAVYLSRVDGHEGLVDRRTLSMAPLARASGLERDGAGEPTGVVHREANLLVRRWSVGAMSETELQAARVAAARTAASRGYTGVHEMGGPDRLGREDFDAWLHGEWPVDIVGYWGAMEPHFAVDRDLRQIGGDIILDGSLDVRTAALVGGYTDQEGERGRLEYDDATLTAFFQEATRAELQVAVHCVGDEAILQAVRCWRAVEASLADYERGSVHRLRHRLEHATVMPPEILPEIATLGLIVSGQPTFESSWGNEGGVYEHRLGPERAEWTSPFRSMANHGIALAFGSGSSSRPLEPWATVHAAQHRREERHALNRLEAYSASTLGGRHAARQERYVGVVRAGMWADLAAWEGDPFSTNDPRDTTCVLTVRRGRRTHGATEFSALEAWEPNPD